VFLLLLLLLLRYTTRVGGVKHLAALAIHLAAAIACWAANVSVAATQS
jgi:hypothetical protein